MTDELLLEGDGLRGFRTVMAVCAEALLNLPAEDVVANVRSVAEALGDDEFNDVVADAALEQRYYDRFFVSAHPAYVPLCEDAVRGGYMDDDRFRYGSVCGKHYAHTLTCYKAVGFDFRRIEGFEPSVSMLKPDSMASELAFLAFLADSALAAEGRDSEVAQRSRELLVTFARDHASRWFGDAVECLERFDEDFYAGVCALAAESVAALVE